MEKTKITNKSRYAAIINVLTGAPSDIETDELVNFCERQIAAIDRKSEKARERAERRLQHADDRINIARAELALKKSIIRLGLSQSGRKE